MSKFKAANTQSGQGLIEYALILALVALVSIAVLVLVSLATQRAMGLACGALGCKKEVRTAQNYVYFDDSKPRCGVASGQLVLYAQFFTDITTVGDWSGTTDTGIPLEFHGNVSPPAGIGKLDISNTLPAGSTCPVSIVLQSSPARGGLTVAYPVIHHDWP